MSVLKIKNGSTWEEIPAGGVGVPSGGTAGQMLMKSSSTDYATEWGLPTPEDIGAVPYEWTLLGTSSSSSQTVTYPADAKEILIKGKNNHASGPGYVLVVPVIAISDLAVILVGGYYSASGDHGLANVNHNATSRTLAFRNIYYGSTSGGTYTFYYR